MVNFSRLGSGTTWLEMAGWLRRSPKFEIAENYRSNVLTVFKGGAAKRGGRLDNRVGALLCQGTNVWLRVNQGWQSYWEICMF